MHTQITQVHRETHETHKCIRREVPTGTHTYTHVEIHADIHSGTHIDTCRYLQTHIHRVVDCTFAHKETWSMHRNIETKIFTDIYT